MVDHLRFDRSQVLCNVTVRLKNRDDKVVSRVAIESTNLGGVRRNVTTLQLDI